jgi:hypothetical protein
MALTHSQNDLFYWRLLHITVPSKRLKSIPSPWFGALRFSTFPPSSGIWHSWTQERLNPFRRHRLLPLAPCVSLLFLLPVAFGTLGLKSEAGSCVISRAIALAEV